MNIEDREQQSGGDDRLIFLGNERIALNLAPVQGGAIASLAYRNGNVTIPVLRGRPCRPASILEAACFPLVPYCNRIRNGRFRFRGRDVTLAPNMEGDPSPLHGQGWLSPWQVVRHDRLEAELSFHHAAGQWPWRYEARQIFSLNGGILAIDLTCRNLSDDAMPCGLGQHPYFTCTIDTRLDTEVDSAWTVDENVLPVEKVEAAGRYDLRDRRICAQDLDNGFGGWRGEARIDDPTWPFRIRLASPDAGFFQLYSPMEGDMFVAEPVTHANAALNEPEADWATLGLKLLEPGEQMRLRTRIEIVGK
ncbi:aldose 1-epimerase [Sphingosinicella rhizophila]|uniref:Aldose 1-epimerase n=1 Tax=Sphingosinicella rhizophila TaxID=3050082 RepID=A0ABU3Q685_9SPHN|nr:aldose 1-epimerase [Sphingosinicella sp. GR2756]MDT9598919.1 aldose 1-epimerase [Sphingosinicella sp. GR2756]